MTNVWVSSVRDLAPRDGGKAYELSSDLSAPPPPPMCQG